MSASFDSREAAESVLRTAMRARDNDTIRAAVSWLMEQAEEDARRIINEAAARGHRMLDLAAAKAAEEMAEGRRASRERVARESSHIDDLLEDGMK
jgi:vacuolar-type H+-ATPase subunit E/Vma4